MTNGRVEFRTIEGREGQKKEQRNTITELASIKKFGLIGQEQKEVNRQQQRESNLPVVLRHSDNQKEILLRGFPRIYVFFAVSRNSAYKCNSAFTIRGHFQQGRLRSGCQKLELGRGHKKVRHRKSYDNRSLKESSSRLIIRAPQKLGVVVTKKRQQIRPKD